jgi:DUF1009 family protein
MSSAGRRIGILAGGGSIPLEIAASVSARRIPVFIVALDGECDGDLAAYPHAVVNWGQIGRMVSAFRARRVTDIVIVGRVSRPDLGKVRPDLGLVLALPMIARIVRAGGDDAVLREVIGFFERKGLRVVGPGDVAPELIVGAGPLGAIRADAADAADIALGLDIVGRLGPLDIGQGVVVAEGRLVAVEGVEGTDRMLERVAALRRQAASGGALEPSGVLIKRPKPGQELRVDLPAIGPATAVRAAEAGLKGIAVLAERTIAAERPQLVRRADALQLFVEGISERGEAASRGHAKRAVAIERVVGSTLSREVAASAVKGARVTAELGRHGAGMAAVVVRRHVLAVEAGEGCHALMDRVADLRQWGESRRRRRGVAVLAAGAPLGRGLVDAAARAGLEGIAIVVDAGAPAPDLAEMIGAAVRHGLFVTLARIAGEDSHG